MPEIKYDLEERLIDFAVMILDLVEKLPKTYAGNYFGGQLTRSGSSPALNYGEAQGAESRKDFLHKVRIVLKELRESQVNLKIIKRKPLLDSITVEPALEECNQLVAIFTKIAKSTSDGIKKNLKSKR